MKRLCLALLIVLALAKPNTVQASITSEVTTAKNFIDASATISGTFEKALAFTAKLNRLSGALGVLTALTAFGNDAGSARHQQVIDEFAKVHKGIARLGEQIGFLEANMKLQHIKTRLFNAFEVLRQAMDLSSSRQHLIDYCRRKYCYDALEQVAHHAPDLLDAYIKSIGSEEDYVKLVPAYAHRLVSIVGNSATVVLLTKEDVNEDYIGLDEMSDEIARLLRNSKWRWKQVLANIKLDAKTVMQQGSKSSNHDVLGLLTRKLRPKFPWLSLGILVYNDISGYSKHYITGHFVSVFHESGKNVVVFYKSKGTDSFKGGNISNDMCQENCDIGCVGPFYCFAKGGAEGCRKEGGDDYGTATIERYNGLWFNFPSDFNYCYRNNEYFTIIAVKD